MLSCHLLCAKGKDDRNDRAECFRDRCHSESHRKEEGVSDIVAAENADAKEDRAEHQNQDRQLLPKLIQIDLERRPLL